MKRAALRRTALWRAGAVRKPALIIEPVAQLLAGFKKRRPFLLNVHRLAAARIAPDARRAMFHRKRAKSTQFNSVAARQRIRNFLKHDRDDTLDIAVKKVRIFVGKLLHQFRLDHISPRSLLRPAP